MKLPSLHDILPFVSSIYQPVHGPELPKSRRPMIGSPTSIRILPKQEQDLAVHGSVKLLSPGK